MKKALIIIIPLVAVAVVVAAAFAFRLTQESRASDVQKELPKPYELKVKKPSTGGFGTVPAATISTVGAPAPTVIPSTGNPEGDTLLKTLNQTSDSDPASDFTNVDQQVSQL